MTTYESMVKLEQILIDSAHVVVTKDPVSTDDFYFIKIYDDSSGVIAFYGKQI